MLGKFFGRYFSTKAQKREQLRRRLYNVWTVDNVALPEKQAGGILYRQLG